MGKLGGLAPTDADRFIVTDRTGCRVVDIAEVRRMIGDPKRHGSMTIVPLRAVEQNT